MASFSYTAVETLTGREATGTLDGASAEEVISTLKRKRLAPVSVRPFNAHGGEAAARAEKRFGVQKVTSGAVAAGATQRSAWKSWIQPRITAKTLTLFTRQLAVLVKAGMPLLRCLEVLERQEANPRFCSVLNELSETIRSGGTLSDGLARHPKIFDRLHVNMIKAGEAGGVLDTILDRLARFLEKAERVKGRVKSAMTYPVIVMALAVAIVAALMVLVVPKFEQIFSGLLKGQPLPALTRIVLGVSQFIQHHVIVCCVLGAVIAVGCVLFKRTPKGSQMGDWLALRIPFLGDLVLKSSVARFTRTFGTLLASGVPILQALKVTRDTSGNHYVAEAIDHIHDRVKEGDGVARPLQSTRLFPEMVGSMIEVGEETGALPEMLTRIADTYDEEVDNSVTALTTVIEPVMIIFLAGVVGTIVIALFLPIVSIIQHLR
jgi:type IV pilus assembly protein PilC